MDTAARERAIEERLERERRLEEQERMKNEKEREPVMRRERSGRILFFSLILDFQLLFY